MLDESDKTERLRVEWGKDFVVVSAKHMVERNADTNGTMVSARMTAANGLTNDSLVFATKG